MEHPLNYHKTIPSSKNNQKFWNKKKHPTVKNPSFSNEIRVYLILPKRDRFFCEIRGTRLQKRVINTFQYD